MRNMLRLAVGVFIAAFAAMPSRAADVGGTAPFKVAAGQGVFLLVTDIHFDPFADPKIVPKLDRSPVSEWTAIFKADPAVRIPGYGKDTTYPLVASALKAAAGLGFRYDYVLNAGDYLSHRFRSTYRRYAGKTVQGLTSFAVKTSDYVGRLLAGSFPGLPIYGTMGNNDAVCGDYQIAPDSPYTAGIAPQWKALSKQPSHFGGFSAHGSYKVAHPTVPKEDIIVLNDVFWTKRYEDRCGSRGSDPGSAVMAWLDRELRQTRQAGRKAQLLMHVPPGINAYSTARPGKSCAARISPFWRDRYNTAFVALMRKYGDVVDYIFTGHTHMDSFAVIPDARGNPLIASQLSPSVSPIFGNNPSFTVVLYDRGDGRVMNSATYYLANLPDAARGAAPSWKLEYTYDQAYSVPDLTAKSRIKVAERIAADPELRAAFVKRYAGTTQGANSMNSSNWQAYSCAQRAVTRAAYQACYCTGN